VDDRKEYSMTAQPTEVHVEGHSGPWTAADYLALGETPDRIELFDGSLLVSHAPSGMHQHVARRLANILEIAGKETGLQAVQAIGVRLRTGRIFIPDVLLTPDIDRNRCEAAEVALVAEVVLPGSAGKDRVLKMCLYADAGIPWYLLVEPGDDYREIRAVLYKLDGEHYVRHAEAANGELLRIDQPVRLELDPAELLRR
jgi:Uma2 family endonuclease